MKDTPHTVGIVGYPLDTTLSPAIHNATFRRMQLPFVYLPFAVAPRYLGNLLACMRLMDVEGLNVTTPHKMAVCPLLPRLDSEARRIGAVNTIVLERGRFTGYNTDAPGFLRAFRRVTRGELRGRSVTIIGAGGAARAVAYAVCQAGASRVVMANRTIRRARMAAGQLRRWFRTPRVTVTDLGQRSLKRALAGTDLLIQASGTSPARPGDLPLPLAALPRSAWIVDLRYGANSTQTLRHAERLGFQHVDGLPLLVEQAALSFALWTGKTMDIATAMRTARKALQSLQNP